MSEHSKVPVTTSGIADSLRGLGEVTIGGVEVPAQNLLESTLQSTGNRPNLSWRLLYDASAQSYEFSLNEVTPQQ